MGHEFCSSFFLVVVFIMLTIEVVVVVVDKESFFLLHPIPDYKLLAMLKNRFPKVPMIALTATATPRVCTPEKVSWFFF